MGVGRTLKSTFRSVRFGDFLFICCAILLVVIMGSLYFHSEGERMHRRKGVWPAGRMRKQGSSMLDSVRDLRSPVCQMQSGAMAKQLKESQLQTAIVLTPSDIANAHSEKFKQTMIALLATTAQFFEHIEIAVVVFDENIGNELKGAFENLNTPVKPGFRVLLREDFHNQETMFKELLSIAATDFPHTDHIVFLQAGVKPSFGWLEMLLEPFISGSINPKHRPVVASPAFDNFNSGRLIFNWRLAPKWIDYLGSETNDGKSVKSTLMFLPQVFAIDRQSEHFTSLLSYIRQHNIVDPTAFDASMYFWRCLGASIVTVPCSRVIVPEDFIHEFDPNMKSPKETKNRLISMWLSTYKDRLAEYYENVDATDYRANCQDLNKVVGASEIQHLFKSSDSQHRSEGYQYLASKAGTTFFPSGGEMRAGICPFPENPEVMFVYTPEGNIKTQSGLCLTSPNGNGFVHIASCFEVQNDSKQKWQLLPNGKLQSIGTGLCMFHASDPGAENKAVVASQVLMVGDCEKEDSNFYRFSFNKNC